MSIPEAPVIPGIAIAIADRYSESVAIAVIAVNRVGSTSTRVIGEFRSIGESASGSQISESMIAASAPELARTAFPPNASM